MEIKQLEGLVVGEYEFLIGDCVEEGWISVEVNRKASNMKLYRGLYHDDSTLDVLINNLKYEMKREFTLREEVKEYELVIRFLIKLEKRG